MACHEAAYDIEVPRCEPTCGHLLADDLVRGVCKGKQTPVNPHAQRLLAAELRAANPAKAKAKPKGSPSAKAKGAPKKKAKRSLDKGNEIEPTRTAYSQAKKEYMEKRLHCNQVLFVFPWVMHK